jgi:protein-S-isoprenylcysteine O-methyltransferase Ste14
MARLSELSPWMRVPPPFFFVAAFLLAWLLHLQLPLRFVPASTPGTRIAGTVIVVAGLLVLASCMALFARARTTVVPHHEASRLVGAGPYRFSRNPMYVGLTIVYVGLALRVNSIWPLLLLPFPLAVLQLVVIPTEERILSGKLGAEYDAYRSRVRRWL